MTINLYVAGRVRFAALCLPFCSILLFPVRSIVCCAFWSHFFLERWKKDRAGRIWKKTYMNAVTQNLRSTKYSAPVGASPKPLTTPGIKSPIIIK